MENLDVVVEKINKILELLTVKNTFKEESQEVGLLMGALAKAQGSYKKLIPNEKSAKGPYANLEAILLATREALSKNAIAFTQNIRLLDEGSGAALLITSIYHDSGQYKSSLTRVFTGKTDRATGISQEIHKRLQAMMLLGIAPSKNDPIAYDDDGGEQEEDQLLNRIIKQEKETTVDPDTVINKAEYQQLIIALGNEELIAKDIMRIYKLETLADMPKEVYQDALAKVRRIKKNQDEYERSKK